MTAGMYRAAHRSDVEVFLDARRALDRQMVVPTTVQVQVFSGTASLTGRVRWREERAEAEAAVRQIPGVLRVTNRIAVETPACPTARGLVRPGLAFDDDAGSQESPRILTGLLGRNSG